MGLYLEVFNFLDKDKIKKYMELSQLAFTYSKSAIEIPKQGVESFQS